MAARDIYPRSNEECVNLLLTLGFVKKRGIGRGKHPEMYMHPKQRNIVPGDKPFVLITHEFFGSRGQILMNKLQHWGFTLEELEAACQGIKPSLKNVNVEVDIESEST